MKRTLQSSVLSVGLAATVSLFSASTPRAQQPQVVDPVQVQTRGPVHEAFAQPNDNQTEPPPTVNQQPPPPIAEQPPQDQPQGANVQWIDGYWAWDADRN